MHKISKIIEFLIDLDSKTKTNLFCSISILITSMLAIISIVTPNLIEFTRPVFVSIWSIMTMMNVMIYWVVITITSYWNERENDIDGN